MSEWTPIVELMAEPKPVAWPCPWGCPAVLDTQAELNQHHRTEHIDKGQRVPRRDRAVAHKRIDVGAAKLDKPKPCREGCGAGPFDTIQGETMHNTRAHRHLGQNGRTATTAVQEVRAGLGDVPEGVRMPKAEPREVIQEATEAIRRGSRPLLAEIWELDVVMELLETGRILDVWHRADVVEIPLASGQPARILGKEEQHG